MQKSENKNIKKSKLEDVIVVNSYCTFILLHHHHHNLSSPSPLSVNRQNTSSTTSLLRKPHRDELQPPRRGMTDLVTEVYPSQNKLKHIP